VIGRGRLIADCSTSEFVERSSDRSVLVRAPQSPRLAEVLTGAGALVQQEADGALTVTRLEAEQVGELAAAHGIVLHALVPQRASLEEAFMALTRDAVEYAGAPA
jgi:ABC-2 type transport system ATP-binding protein